MPQLVFSLSEHFSHLRLKCKFGAVRLLLVHFDFSLDFREVSLVNGCLISCVEQMPFVTITHSVKVLSFSN
jgi:hypothetical protein